MSKVNVNVTHVNKVSLHLLLKRKMTVYLFIESGLTTLGESRVAYANMKIRRIKRVIAIPCGAVCPVVICIMGSAVQVVLVRELKEVE